MAKRILVVTNPHRPDTVEAGAHVSRVLSDLGVEVVTEYDPQSPDAVEAALVLGGDGTMLHAAALTRGSGVALLGVNLGRVGFLAELERDGLDDAARRLAAGDYDVEERGTLDVIVTHSDGTHERGWALNEATLERDDRRRTLEIAVEIDRRPLSTFGCDGIIVATSTGSTAHAFSAGGPVLWPQVDALMVVPLAAHSLFARPLVVGPGTPIAIEIVDPSETDAVVILDGSRTITAERGSRVEVAQGEHRVRLARVADAPFTQRLVHKFSLPTNGWKGERGHRSRPAPPDEDG